LGRKVSVEVHLSGGKVGVFGEKNIEKYEVCAAKASVFILA